MTKRDRHPNSIFARFKVTVYVRGEIRDEALDTVGAVLEGHVEEPLTACLNSINRNLRTAGLPITLTMSPF
jgi:hypothetical protein